MFPATNVWNQPVDGCRSLRQLDADRLDRAGPDAPLTSVLRGLRHPVPGRRHGTPRTRSRSTMTTSPTPARTRSRTTPQIEAGSDRHILMVDKDHCRLYELFARSTRRRLARRLRRDWDIAPTRCGPLAGPGGRRRPADPARPRPRVASWRPASSSMRSGSPHRAPARRTSTLPATTPAPPAPPAADGPARPPEGVVRSRGPVAAGAR